MRKINRNYQGPFKKTPDRLFALGLILLYQNTFSLIIGRHCCYSPSCSEYGYEAIARYGLWLGGFLTLFRILRCHPFRICGEDPVPIEIINRPPWYKIWRYYHISYENYKKNLLLEQKND